MAREIPNNTAIASELAGAARSELLVSLLLGDPDLKRILSNYVEFFIPLGIPADQFAGQVRLDAPERTTAVVSEEDAP
jgi:hypothetical protein